MILNFTPDFSHFLHYQNISFDCVKGNFVEIPFLFWIHLTVYRTNGLGMKPKLAIVSATSYENSTVKGFYVINSLIWRIIFISILLFDSTCISFKFVEICSDIRCNGDISYS